MADLQIIPEITSELLTYSLFCPQRPDFCLRNATITIETCSGRRSNVQPLVFVSENTFQKDDLPEKEIPFESSNTKVLEVSTENQDLCGFLQICQDINKNYLCMKLRIVNRSSTSRNIKRIELLNLGSYNQHCSSQVTLSETESLDELAFFSNGWQSWSFSGSYDPTQAQRKSWLRFIPNVASSNPDTPYSLKKGHYSGDFFGVLGNRHNRVGFLMGFLSQKEQFGSLVANLKGAPGMRVWANCDEVCLNPGDGIETDWLLLAWLDLDDPEALQPYFQMASRYHNIKIKTFPPVGWCSWYQYFTDIDQHKIIQNVENLNQKKDSLPIKMIQIDDGFQAAGGDWDQFSPGFPEGVEPLAKNIRRSELSPGLWLAPFIVSQGADLLRDHPDFILRNRFGLPVNAGFISNKVSTALDISYSPALEYACEVVRKAVLDWGFSYLKLDFLYAGALPGRRWDQTRTRAQILRKGLECIRGAVGEETFLLGCGLPLGSALGLFDGMRIGADTGLSWKPKLFNIPILLRNDPQLPSTQNAIQNIITRSGMHQNWWINDPDCLLLRPDTGLAETEIKTHATLIGLSGGSLLISDDFSKLSAERIRIAAVLLPLMGKRPMVMDWFDTLTPRRIRIDLDGPIGPWKLLAYFNWDAQPHEAIIKRADYHLGGGSLWVRSFWGEERVRVERSETIWHQNLPPRGVILLAVREDLGEIPQYLGSDLHISQGYEVQQWNWTENELRIELALDRLANGNIEVYLPRSPAERRMKNHPVKFIELSNGVYQIPVSFMTQQKLIIRFN